MITLQIPTTTEFHPVRLVVSAAVRYWEDCEVNGIEDEDGKLIPLRSGDLWKPEIELATGRVIDWPMGTRADISYKVCDAGQYWLEDSDGKRAEFKSHYVPRCLAVEASGGGDYIIMIIEADGVIKGWKEPEFNAEDWKLV